MAAASNTCAGSNASCAARAVAIRSGTAVHSVVRDGAQSIVHSAAGTHETFDQVIFACHSDQALRLLDRPTTREHAVLSAIRSFRTTR